MNGCVGDVQVLVLHVGGSGDVSELNKFFNGGTYGRDWVRYLQVGMHAASPEDVGRV